LKPYLNFFENDRLSRWQHYHGPCTAISPAVAGPFLPPFCAACRICVSLEKRIINENIQMFHHPISLPSWWLCISGHHLMLTVPCPPLVPFLLCMQGCGWFPACCGCPGPSSFLGCHWAALIVVGHPLELSVLLSLGCCCHFGYQSLVVVITRYPGCCHCSQVCKFN
jgi:hypothetical protein